MKHKNCEIDWNDFTNFLEKNEDEIKSFISHEIEFDDVINYLDGSSLSDYETDQILESIEHECEEKYEDEYQDMNTKRLPVLTLDDEQKFEIIERLYNNLTYQQLQEIENMNL